MDVTDYMQVNYSVAVSWLLCNPIHLIRMFSFCNKAASSAFPEPTNYVIDLIQPTTVMLNQISKEGIKCKKCGKKKIGDGSYYPSNLNQPMSRDQLSKNHFK